MPIIIAPMDPALLREREAFKRKALVTPAIESKKHDSGRNEPSKKKAKPSNSVPGSSKLELSSYKSMSGSSQYRFSVLAKIVKYMKTRHKTGDDYALTIEDILDETNQLDVGAKSSCG